MHQPVVHDALLAALLERLARRFLSALALLLGWPLALLLLFLPSRFPTDYQLRGYQQSYTVFFLATAPLRGPFRVRALVRVR